MLFGQRNQAEAELNAIAWLLREGRKPFQMPKVQPYGDLTELNTDGTILRTVGKDLLVNVAGDALHLMGGAKLSLAIMCPWMWRTCRKGLEEWRTSLSQS